MSEPTPQTYYASQSRITDPGEYRYLYDDLPHDIAGISQVVQGLVLHYFGDKWQYDYPPERTCEIDTRYIPAMLRRILELDERSLHEKRSPDKRLIGCCRDFTALAVSMLRNLGIPARARHGFADYFVPEHYVDHVVVEFWNGTAWQLADSEIPAAHFNFDVLNVPRDRFIVGGQAWQMCKAGKADPELFGLGPGVPIKGWPFIKSRMLQDLAALNKTEMLCWDEWSQVEDDSLMDHLAVVSQQGDAGFAEVQRLFTEDEHLRLANVITSYSAASPEPLKVRLM